MSKWGNRTVCVWLSQDELQCVCIFMVIKERAAAWLTDVFSWVFDIKGALWHTVTMPTWLMLNWSIFHRWTNFHNWTRWNSTSTVFWICLNLLNKYIDSSWARCYWRAFIHKEKMRKSEHGVLWGHLLYSQWVGLMMQVGHTWTGQLCCSGLSWWFAAACRQSLTGDQM